MPSVACLFSLVLASQAFCVFAVHAVMRDEKTRPSLMAMSVSASAQTDDIDMPEEMSGDEVLETRVQGMLNDVEDMVRSGTNPEPDKIKMIKGIVADELVPDLKATRDSAAKQVGINLGAIDTCNSNAVTKLQDIKATTEVSVGKQRTEHATCREGEKDKNSTKGSKCTELDEFLNGINVPADVPKGRARDQMVQYTKTMSEYFCPKGPTVTTLDEACKLAEKEHFEHKSRCDRLQAAFEMGFCTWRTELNDACVALSACYQSAVKIYNDHMSETKELVKKWKVEYAALKKILCYVDVWLSDNDVKTASADQFNKCNGASVDTSPMDIDFGTPAKQAQCSMTAVENYPGTTGFVTTEYANFKDYVSEVIPCLPIEPTPGPTVAPTTPAPTNAPTTTTLPAGHGFDGSHIVNWMIQKKYQPQKKGLCGLELNAKTDDLHASGEGGEWVKYFKSGSRNAGCGGACNRDNGINIECHYIGVSKGNLRGVTAYAKTYLISDADKELTLYLGSDDGIAVWLNGKSVFQKLNACHCYKDKQYNTKIKLKKGVNLLVVKVGENDGHFGFTAQLDNADGMQAAEAATYIK